MLGVIHSTTVPLSLVSCLICFLFLFFRGGREKRGSFSLFRELCVYSSFCCIGIVNGKVLMFLPPWETWAIFKKYTGSCMTLLPDFTCQGSHGPQS